MITDTVGFTLSTHGYDLETGEAVDFGAPDPDDPLNHARLVSSGLIRDVSSGLVTPRKEIELDGLLRIEPEDDDNDLARPTEDSPISSTSQPRQEQVAMGSDSSTQARSLYGRKTAQISMHPTQKVVISGDSVCCLDPSRPMY